MTSVSTMHRDASRGNPAVMFGPPPTIGRILREVLYAPACPNRCALLFEVGLTRHNTQHYEAAINAYLQGLTAWEESCAQRLEAEQGIAGLSLEPKPLILSATESTPSVVAPSSPTTGGDGTSGGGTAATTGGSPSRRKRLAAAAAAATADPSSPSTAEGGAAGRPSAAGGLSAVDEEQLRLRAEQEARRLQQLLESRAVIREQAMVAVPLEGRIFVRLAIGSVFESAGHDARALSEYLEAHRLAQQLPVAHATLVMATVFSCLGSVYNHLSQYDLAADYFFRALEIRFENNGPTHVDTAQLANNIGAVLLTLGRPNDALVMLYRAKDVFEAQLDRAHPRVDIVLRNIALAKGDAMREAPPVPPCKIVLPVRTPPAAPVKKGKDGDDKKKGKKKGK